MDFRIRILAVSFALAVLAGCGLPGAPLPPSLELPKPVTDLRAERRGDQVTLTWSSPRETTDRGGIRRIGATRVCLADEPLNPSPTAPQACATYIGSLVVPPSKREDPHPAQASYTHTLPTALQEQHPLDQAVYTVEVLNDHGRSAGPSNPAAVPLAPTLPAPKIVEARVTADGPVITLARVAGEAQVAAPGAPREGNPSFAYRLYRREKAKPQSQPVIVPAQAADGSGGATIALRDPTAQWEQTYQYWTDVVTIVSAAGKTWDVPGENSAAVDVFVHDIFPPRVPTGLQAVYTEAGNERFVDLTWLPAAGADVAGYNVYRHEQGGTTTKINSALVRTPTFRDMNIAAGHKYFYAVTAVDIRGNESKKSAEASEQVPK